MVGALATQRTIILRSALGWRPMTPQARGGKKHLIEPSVSLPGPPDDWNTAPYDSSGSWAYWRCVTSGIGHYYVSPRAHDGEFGGHGHIGAEALG